jgi:hypothetical protein
VRFSVNRGELVRISADWAYSSSTGRYQPAFFIRAIPRMNLAGKTREQIEVALASKSRTELLDLIFSLVTVEQLLKPAEIAARSCLNKRAVLRDIRDGKFGDYYCRAENSIAIPASGVNAWRRAFRVPVK